jgi:hypothetical protein
MRVVGIGYHQPSAQDARRRIIAFFDTHLNSKPNLRSAARTGASGRRPAPDGAVRPPATSAVSGRPARAGRPGG